MTQKHNVLPQTALPGKLHAVSSSATRINSCIGLHVVGEIFTRSFRPLKKSSGAKQKISAVIKRYGFHELGSYYYDFPDYGFTGVIALCESHIAIHTWPEYGFITLDVFICNHAQNNEAACSALFDEIVKLFSPTTITKRHIRRLRKKSGGAREAESK
jgi:S-adenosylmethionine decarboxylase proenzyme